MIRRLSLAIPLAGVAIVIGSLALPQPLQAAETSLAALSGKSHFIAVDSSNPSRLFLATHHGFYAVSLDGSAKRISSNTDDYMGFTPHPTDPKVLYGSGNPVRWQSRFHRLDGRRQ